MSDPEANNQVVIKQPSINKRKFMQATTPRKKRVVEEVSDDSESYNDTESESEENSSDDIEEGTLAEDLKEMAETEKFKAKYDNYGKSAKKPKTVTKTEYCYCITIGDRYGHNDFYYCLTFDSPMSIASIKKTLMDAKHKGEDLEIKKVKLIKQLVEE